MKMFWLLLATGFTISAQATTNFVETEMISEVVYVESPTDTNNDGQWDRLYVSIDRPNVSEKLATMYYISPYALGGTEIEMHGVDVDLLPQDQQIQSWVKKLTPDYSKNFKTHQSIPQINVQKYARISVHSLGTGRSTGCPTVGDDSEALAAKAVIDWLNGRAKAYYADGRVATADWANGNVGMTGVSYDGSLPVMVAATGVEGLKAIVPIAAVTSWYDYYRANGLVVNPGGYIGEDADILGYYIARPGDCVSQMQNITRDMGREHGDFTKFWQDREYLKNADKIKAATFIIHGQSDWNVKQKHAIQLWEVLNTAPKRMFLHRGGHSSTSAHGVPMKIQQWFDHYVQGVDNGITDGPQVEVELPNGELMKQENWPHEKAAQKRLYFASNQALQIEADDEQVVKIVDNGRTQSIERAVENPTQVQAGRLIFLSETLQKNTVLTGTAILHINMAVANRRAANLSYAIVEYDANGRAKIITRGWADPQNHRDLTQGDLLNPGQKYQLQVPFEPKQYRFLAGSRIGVLLASTDYLYTLRPTAGTQIDVTLGMNSFVDLELVTE
jgi:X-Pro dipeptidyl-peptidase